MAQVFQILRLDRAQVGEFIRHVDAKHVTVTGWVGSGYSLVTDALGNDAYAPDLTGPWTTRYLLLMRDPVPPRAIELLPDPVGMAAMIRGLDFGAAVLVEAGSDKDRVLVDRLGRGLGRGAQSARRHPTAR